MSLGGDSSVSVSYTEPLLTYVDMYATLVEWMNLQAIIQAELLELLRGINLICILWSSSMSIALGLWLLQLNHCCILFLTEKLAQS